VRHDRVSAIISGANPILNAIRLADWRIWAACERGPRPRRVPGTFARAGKIKKKFGRRRALRRLLRNRCRGSLLRPKMRPPSDSGIPIQKILTQKSPRPIFPARAFLISAMVRICR
jgi:hypothetical protein